jgi:hypothetical protein
VNRKVRCASFRGGPESRGRVSSFKTGSDNEVREERGRARLIGRPENGGNREETTEKWGQAVKTDKQKKKKVKLSS